MKKEFNGFGKIFRYTFKNQISAKSYIAITVIIGILFLLIPPAIMISIELFGGEEEPTGLLETIYIVDDGKFENADFALMSLVSDELKNVEFEYIGNDAEKALQATSENSKSLILDISSDNAYTLNVLLPEESDLNYSDVNSVTSAIYPSFSILLLQNMELSPEALAALSTRVDTSLPADKNDLYADDSPDEDTVKLISMIAAYINIMLLYFLVLSYGTSVANSLILEKTSKLMEFFLITVKPGAIMLGKVVGIAVSAVMQFMIWVISLIGGFTIGVFSVKAINPDSDMLVLKLLDTAGEYASFISIPGTVLGVIIVIAGFFMYCSLGAIGGALARKTEDLGATNYIFTLTLVASMFITMFSGSDGMMSYTAWHDFLPFTAVLVTPAHLIVGESSVFIGGISLLLIAASFFALIYIAGRVYKSMVFYKGNIPKIKDVLKLIINKE